MKAISNKISHLYEFGDFRFDTEKKVLWRGTETLLLPPKATDVLAVLIEDHGELVERDHILRAVWQDTFVEEGNLNNAVSALRKVLGEDGIIQTVPRRGYRFTADVREMASGAPNGLVIEKRTLSQTTIEVAEEILPSRAAYPQLSAKPGSFFVIAVVGVAVLAVLGAAWYFGGPADTNLPGTRIATKTLVILPLRSLNEKEDDNAFALGITENLASRLGEIDQLIVRPTSTASRLAETENDPIVIGQKLGSDAILDGSYQIDGGRIRIMVRLLNVADGSQIWSGNFDEAESDIFKLQDSLSAQAAKHLTDRLTQKQEQQLGSRPTENVDAYKLYVRGRHAWNKRTRESILASINLFRAAIDADPTFSLAYAGLADSYVILNDYDAAPPSESFPKAKAAAVRALEIQPDLVGPRITLAYVLASYDWNHADAEREYKLAIEMNPNYATAHQWYGEMLCALGRFPEAEIELERAADLDPLVPIVQSEVAVNLYYSGKYDDVIAHYARLKQEHPAFPTSYLFSAWAYEQKGFQDNAFAEEIQFWKLQNLGDAAIKDLEAAYKRGGKTEFLENLAGMIEKTAGEKYFHEYRLIHLYGRLRNRDKVLEWLEKGVENRSSNVWKVYIDPNFEFLRGDPQFRNALAKMNLPSN